MSLNIYEYLVENRGEVLTGRAGDCFFLFFNEHREVGEVSDNALEVCTSKAGFFHLAAELRDLADRMEKAINE